MYTTHFEILKYIKLLKSLACQTIVKKSTLPPNIEIYTCMYMHMYMYVHVHVYQFISSVIEYQPNV